MRCAQCSNDLKGSAGDDEPVAPPLEPQNVDDSFVVVLDALDGSEGDPFARQMDLLGPRHGDANDSHAGVSESMRRQSRLRRRAAGVAAAASTEDPVCSRCAAAMASLLDEHAKSAHARAELYVRSEREHALREATSEAARPRRARRDDDAELVAKRDALNEAVAVARREARATRAARDEVRRATAALEAEEARFWDDARAQDGAFDAFRERCAGLVSRATRKKDEDRTLDALAETLDKLDVDKAPFAAVDAYVRSVCKQLETKGEDRKIIGTFVPDTPPTTGAS